MFRRLTYDGNTAAGTLRAGDADGDGIADSLLFRIPGMSLDGLTWFAGVRIIDNNSAINANTAWSRDQDFIYSGTPSALTDIPTFLEFVPDQRWVAGIVNIGDIPGVP